MELILDEHIKAVLEFMQGQIPASKLVGVAERMPQIAKLLWDRYPQEAVDALSLTVTKKRPSQSDANEFVPVLPCAGDGSVVEAGVR
jgi:hypothetical protein